MNFQPILPPKFIPPKRRMWLILFCWIVICIICMGICHCWLALKRKWELKEEMRNIGNGQRPKNGRIHELAELERGQRREPRQQQQEQQKTTTNSAQRIYLPLEWTETENGGNGDGMLQQQTAEHEEQIDGQQRQQQMEPQLEMQPATFSASSTTASARLPLFLRRAASFRRAPFASQDHGQGPIRFRVQPIQQSAAANPQQQQPGTSYSSSASAAKAFDLSNAALASFFSQLLSNLGVNLTNGNVFLFAEQDHDIIWLHLGQGTHDGLYAIHPHSMDDIVTELLEKFAELFLPEGLLPYELERMPRAKIDPVKHAQLMKEAKTSCTICLAQIYVGEQMTELGCHHFFHSDCIHAWLLHRNTCPTCRAAVLFEDPNKIVKKFAGVFV